MELGVPLEPKHVFRLGSITKQFTAVAILMLAEEGKLSLDDDITEHLPGYPTGGHRITIEDLLHHTSGIVSYTGMPEWRVLIREELEPDSLIAIFRDQPLEFEPGTEWSYSNSGYALLGRIIEVASGEGYAEFIRSRIFEPLGMADSYYGDPSRIIPNRAEGYERTETGWRNDDYLSMSSPYAAGALLSTVDDLDRWYDALEAGTLVEPALLDQAYTSARLADGRHAGYGYGWTIGDIAGYRSIEHGGGIPGFLTHALRVPQEDLLVIVLTNRVAQPGPAATALAAELAHRRAHQIHRRDTVREVLRHAGGHRAAPAEFYARVGAGRACVVHEEVEHARLHLALGSLVGHVAQRPGDEVEQVGRQREEPPAQAVGGGEGGEFVLRRGVGGDGGGIPCRHVGGRAVRSVLRMDSGRLPQQPREHHGQEKNETHLYLPERGPGSVSF